MRAIKAGDIELLEGLPDWAVSATMEHRVFMSNEDDYAGLWVAFPLEHNEIYVALIGMPEDHEIEAIAFCAHPNDILVYRGEGHISVLTDRIRVA